MSVLGFLERLHFIPVDKIAIQIKECQTEWFLYHTITMPRVGICYAQLDSYPACGNETTPSIAMRIGLC